MRRNKVLLPILVLGIASSLSAEVTSNLTLPFDQVMRPICTERPVALTGAMHMMVMVQDTGLGTMITTQSNAEGISGTDLITGARYQLIGTAKTTTFSEFAPPYFFTRIFAFRMIGAGLSSDYVISWSIHVTVNPDGETTAHHDFESITCRP